MLDDREGKDVVADNGPVSLGCLSDGGRPCSPAVLMPGEGDDWFYLSGLGTDDFLTPGSDMELFIDELYARSGATSSIIGGFDGVARRVELTLDRRHGPGRLDRRRGHVGRRHAVLGRDPRRGGPGDGVRRAGEVVQERQVRDCDGGVDCEVR